MSGSGGATAGWLALAGVVTAAIVQWARDRRLRKPKTTLNAEAHSLADRTEADVTGQWQQMYLDLQENFTRRIAAAEQRAGAAETRAVQAESTARAMARQASLREQHVIALENALRAAGITVPPRPYGLDLNE